MSTRKKNPNLEHSNLIINLSKTFSVKGTDGLTWVEAMPVNTWHTIQYGEVPITPERLQKMVANFKSNIFGQEIAIDYNHRLDPAKGTKAAGWIRDAQVRGSSLWLGVEFTDPAKTEIKNKEWKYFSLEWDDIWMSNIDGSLHEDVITGGALTNNPLAKGLVPINFSEVFIDSEDERLKNLATKDFSSVVAECADLEHSEPGTGNPPTPRTDVDSDPAIDTGSRRDPLPVPLETEDVMNREQMVAFAKAIGVKVDKKWSDDELVEKITEHGEKMFSDLTEFNKLKDEIEPLRKAFAEANTKKAFAEAYPEEAKRMAELERSNRENGAKLFSERIERVKDKKPVEGTDEVELKPTKLGLSGLALQSVTEAHKKFAEGIGTVADFEDALVKVVEGGIVDYSEAGSSQEPEQKPSVPTDHSEARNMFADLVKKKQNELAAMEENKSKDSKVLFSEAIRLIARENPELAKAYRMSAAG